MPKTIGVLTDEVQSELGDDTTTYTDAIVAVQIEKAVRKVSETLPDERRVSFFIESRTGTATSDTADSLVDTDEAQFLATDADKVIHNTQNNTWAIVTSATDAVALSKLALSKDIFVDGDEAYEIYNKGCSSKFQINIESVPYYIDPPRHGVFKVEYPIGTERNFTIEGDILTIDVGSVKDSKVVDPAVDTEVYVWFRRRHFVSQLADLLGASNGEEAAGATSMDVDTLYGADTIAEGQEFTVENIRGTYMATLTVVLGGTNGGQGSTSTNGLEFWPPLESALGDGKVITFIGSTLNTEIEGLVVELAAAYCALSIQANAIPKGGADTYRRYETKLAIALNALEILAKRKKPMVKRSWPRD